MNQWNFCWCTIFCILLLRLLNRNAFLYGGPIRWGISRKASVLTTWFLLKVPWWGFKTRVADPHHFKADQRVRIQLFTSMQIRIQPLHFNADPNPDPDPAHQSDRNLRLMLGRPSRASFFASRSPVVSVHGSPRLYFEPLKASEFWL